jgi:RNA polymerase sigma factor (sigma-70 family)
MNTADSQRLLQHIRRLAGDPSGAPSDGELLQRYLVARDEAAFAALMRRHGPMVFSVCQSVLRQRDDAEDAFQAAFLILARKAGSVRRHEGLGGWLQRVAYRVALKARADNLRRQEREAKTARSAAEEPSGDELSWGELRAILHAELAALPERFRAPLVLCYLEGLTQEEAAHRLGWTATMVKGCLQRGREKLRRRLEHRGVALTTALGAALTGQTLTEAAIPSSALPTAAAIALASGFLRPVLPIKLALLSVLLTISVVAGGLALRSPAEPRPSESDTGFIVSRETINQRKTGDAHGDPLPEGAIARLGTVRFNHGDGLNALFFSVDGKTIFSEGNGTIRVWNAVNGKEIDHLTDKVPFSGADDQTRFLRDSNTLITLYGGYGGDVAHVWDLEQKKETRTLTLPVKRQGGSAIHRNALSPDGKLALLHVWKPAQVQIFDLTTGKHLYELAKGEKEFEKEFLAVAFAGNDRIATVDVKQNFKEWEAQTGKFLRQITHEPWIRYLLGSPNGRWLASLETHPWHSSDTSTKQKVLSLWDMHTGKVKHALRSKATRWIIPICFSPDSKTLLTSSNSSPWETNEVVLWDCDTGQRLLEFDGTSGITAGIAAISPDGSRLAAVSAAGKFELWSLKDGKCLSTQASRHAAAESVALSPSGVRASIVGRESLSYWDATSGRLLEVFPFDQDLPLDKELRFLNYLARSTDGRYAVSLRLDIGGREEVSILVWDLAARKCLHTLRLPAGDQRISEVSSAFPADSPLLATWHPSKQTRICLWDLRSDKLIGSFPETKAGSPGKMVFTADGKTLFVAGKNVVGFEVATGKELFSWRLKPPSSASRGETIAVGGTPMSDNDRIGWNSLAVSPDGTRIATIPWPGSVARGSEEDAIGLYDARTGKLLLRCKGLDTTRSYVKPLAFSTDGQLLTSSDGESIHVWEVATGKPIRTFKGHRGHINSLVFSRDDRRLASASSDSTVLIWDTTGSPGRLTTDAALADSWKALAGDDAKRAQDAVWALARTPEKSIPLLAARLHPVQPVILEQLERWIKDLDSDQFAVREKATTELQNLRELAQPALRRVLEGKPTLEQRRRIEPILAELESKPPSGDVLRSLRAVRVLEHAGTAEARRLLSKLAGGAEGQALTRQAQAALTRPNQHAP